MKMKDKYSQPLAIFDITRSHVLVCKDCGGLVYREYEEKHNRACIVQRPGQS